MENLIEYILKFGDINEQQIRFIKLRTSNLALSKGDFFSEAEKKPMHVGFVLDGILRFYKYDNNGEEITNYFIGENQFATEYDKFEQNTIGSEYIRAVTDCKLLVFSRKDWNEIANKIGDWDLIVANSLRNCMTEAVERRSPLVTMDATTRYLSFMKTFPTLFYRIPLSYIASYLGIRQQSLSRIRKNIG